MTTGINTGTSCDNLCKHIWALCDNWREHSGILYDYCCKGI